MIFSQKLTHVFLPINQNPSCDQIPTIWPARGIFKRRMDAEKGVSLCLLIKLKAIHKVFLNCKGTKWVI